MKQLLEIYKKHRKFAFVTSAGIIVLIGTIIGYNALRSNDLAARVGGLNITNKQVTERVWYNKQFQGDLKTLKPSQAENKQALDKLIEYRLLEIQASRSGLTLSSQDLDAEIKNRRYDLSSFNAQQASISKEAIRQLVLRDKVAGSVIVAAESREVIIPFFRYYFADNKRYEEDKIYAKTLADAIYAQLKSGQLTIEQARVQAAADPRVGLKPLVDGYGYINYSFGNDFSRSQFLLQESGAHTTLLTASREGINEPRALDQQLSNPESSGDIQKTFPASWVIVVLKDRNNGQFATYPDWLSDAKQRNNVRIY